MQNSWLSWDLTHLQISESEPVFQDLPRLRKSKSISQVMSSPHDEQNFKDELPCCNNDSMCTMHSFEALQDDY